MTDDRKPVRARPSLVPYLIPVAGGFLGTVAVSAACTRAPSRDSVGNPTSYEPARAVDGDPTTA